jgi:hypothetical protein
MSHSHEVMLMGFTGELYSPLEFNHKSVEIVARALSRLPRFSGQTTRFLSVAQHCVMMADIFLREGDEELALWAILHDFAEAYMGDIPSPLKKTTLFAEYVRLENEILANVARYFNLPPKIPLAVQTLDARIAYDEAIAFMPPNPSYWINAAAEKGITPIGLGQFRAWRQEESFRRFSTTAKRLVNRRLGLAS